MREQTNIGSDHINHTPFLLVLFIANKILNRHLRDVGSKSMAERRNCCSGGDVWSEERGVDKGREREKQRRGQVAEQDGGKQKQVQESKRQKEGWREGGAGLTSTWFNILLYSVLRASRVTRTRPS